MPLDPLHGLISPDGSKAPPDTFSVLERVMWCSRPTECREGQQRHVIPKPAECDHSPVKLPPFSNNKRCRQQAGGGKRGRCRKRQGQGRGTGSELFQNQQQHDDQQQQQPQQQPQLSTVGHCAGSALTDRPTAGHQSDVDADRPEAGGERPDMKGPQDAQVYHADTTNSSAGEGAALERAGSSGAASNLGDEYAANEAVEGSDLAVMAAMGFSEFGSSRG